LARQNLNRGTTANDGSGDTLRQAGLKINQNFSELYSKLGSGVDSANNLSTVMGFDSSALTFDSASYTVSLKATTPTANRTIYLPNASDTLVGKATTDTLTNKTLTSAVLTTPVISTISNSGTLTLPTGTDTIVGRDTTDTLANKTLNLPTLTNPTLNGDIYSTTFSVELLTFTQAGASAVNNFDISNATTGNSPILTGDGDDVNISLDIKGKGSGAVVINKPALDFNEQTITGNVSTTKSHIIANSGTPITLTLTNGLKSGELKVFTNKGAGIATVTPNNFANGTSVALDQYDTATFIWDGTNWYLISNYGATIS